MSPTDRPYAGRSSQLRREDRRSKLLEAGLDLIGEGGSAALTVRGVSARAALTPRYFYEEFGSVVEFARQLFDREFDLSVAAVSEAIAAVGSETEERVAASVGVFLDFVHEVPSRASLLLTESSGSSVLADRRRERMEDVVALLSALGTTTYRTDRATEADVVASESAVRTAATFVAGGFAQTIDAWLRGQIDLSRDALVRQLAGQIVAVGDAAFRELRADAPHP